MMAKTLEFTTKSPRQIKQGDTETTFTFICKNDGSVVDLTKATNITAKIGNASGYLRSQSITITSLAGLSTGWFNLNPMPTLIAGLPAGDYQLEVWVADQAGTSIYPSDKPLGFTITNNIESESGASITTIAFDDFVKAMNKAASTIAKGDKGDDGLSAYQVAVINGYKGSQTDWLASLVGETGLTGDKGDPGKDFRIVKTFPSIATMNGDGFSDGDFTMIASDVNDPDNGKLYVWNGTSFTYIADLSGSQGIKGDTGTVDNAGLISAPAFQSLQTQVNNSAVGTNLLTGTGYHTITGSNTSGYLSNETTNDLLPLLKRLEGQTVTVSVDYKYSGFIAGSGPNRLGWEAIIYADSALTLSCWYRPKNDSGSGRISSTFVVPKNITGAIEGMGYIQFYGSGTGTLSHLKLEKGSVATDWCPNPSEILTQSDYAKIKAAIVALGGALS